MSDTVLDIVAMLCLVSIIIGCVAVVATIVAQMPWVLAVPVGMLIFVWAMERVTRI